MSKGIRNLSSVTNARCPYYISSSVTVGGNEENTANIIVAENAGLVTATIEGNDNIKSYAGKTIVLTIVSAGSEKRSESIFGEWQLRTLPMCR